MLSPSIHPSIQPASQPASHIHGGFEKLDGIFRFCPSMVLLPVRSELTPTFREYPARPLGLFVCSVSCFLVAIWGAGSQKKIVLCVASCHHGRGCGQLEAGPTSLTDPYKRILTPGCHDSCSLRSNFFSGFALDRLQFAWRGWRF